jgi:hypothetical protein
MQKYSTTTHVAGVKKLRTANQRVRYLSNAEEEALFKALNGQDWVKNIIVMAIN